LQNFKTKDCAIIKWVKTRQTKDKGGFDMPIAGDMKKIAEDIAAASEARLSALTQLGAETRAIMDDTNRMVSRFAAERKKAKREQSKDLGQFVSDLAGEVSTMLEETRDRVSEMTEERSKTAKDLRTMLAHEKAKIQGYVESKMKELESKMKEFRASHSEMSDALRKDLKKFVSDVVASVEQIQSDTQTLVKEYRSDMRAASAAWKGISIGPRKKEERRVAVVEKTAPVKETKKRTGKKTTKKASRSK
jgi:uncharacterized protein YicC (UPF0701 family)